MKLFRREAGENDEVRQSKGVVLAVQCSEKTPTVVQHTLEALQSAQQPQPSLPSSVAGSRRRAGRETRGGWATSTTGTTGGGGEERKRRGRRRLRRAEFEGNKIDEAGN